MAIPNENVSDQIRKLLEESGSGESRLARFKSHREQLEIQRAKVASKIKEQRRLVHEAVDSPIRPLLKSQEKIWSEYGLRKGVLRRDIPASQGELAKQMRGRFGVKFAQDIHDSAGTYRAHRLLTASGKAIDISEIMRDLDYLSPTMKKKIAGFAKLREIEKTDKKGKRYTRLSQQLELAMTKLVQEDIRHEKKAIKHRWDRSDPTGYRADKIRLGRMEAFESTVFEGPARSQFNPVLRSYEQELSRATRVVSAESFDTIVFGGSKVAPRGIEAPIYGPSTLAVAGSFRSPREERLARMIEDGPRHIGIYRETRIGLDKKTFAGVPQTIDSLKTQGYSTAGLKDLLGKVVEEGSEISLRANELVIKTPGKEGRWSGKGISVPLFSTAINPSSGAGGGNWAAAEYMFKRGSTYSVPSLIGKIDKEGQLSEPKKFSEVLYDELSTSIGKQGVRGTREYDLVLNRALGAQENLFDPTLPWKERVKNTAGLVDPISYSGRQKLGRHLLGASQQMAMEVDPESTLHRLLTEEMSIRSAYQRGDIGQYDGGKADASKMQDRLKAAQHRIMEHLHNKVFIGTENISGIKFDDLNIAWAPQSGESIFRPTILDKNRSNERLYIKATTANVKNLALLPSQSPWAKGQQFQLSRDAIQIHNIGEIPTAVSGIMGYGGEVNTALRNEIRSLDPGAKAFNQTHVAFGRKTVGLQFFDKELNRLIFGDSGVAMSGGLVKQLDIDPVTGLSRHTLTHTINLRSHELAGDLTFTGMLRSDLHAAIQAHQDMLQKGSRQIRFKPGQEIQLQVLKEHESTHGRRKAIHIEPGLPVDPEGKVVIGESAKFASEVSKADLEHTHDMLNIARKRGLDPAKTVITGVRLLAGSGGLELTMAEKGAATMVDAGYILDHQRVSVGQVIDDKAVRNIFGLAGIKSETEAGLVLGDLGLEIIKDKKVGGVRTATSSYGHNVTLMRNLAELVSQKAKGSKDHRDVKYLVGQLGGKAQTITQPGRGSIVQFQGLGKNIENIHDKDFMNKIRKVASRTIGEDVLLKETFTKVKIQDVLDQLPAYQTGDAAEQKRIKEGFVASGENTAAILKASKLPKDEVWMVKSIAAELAIRGEEPLVKLGRDAVNIKLRDIAMLSEAVDFARTDTNLSDISNIKKDVVGSLIDSHPELFKKNNEISLIYQQRQFFKKDAAGFVAVEKALAEKKVGQLAILQKAAKGAGPDGLRVDAYQAAKSRVSDITTDQGKASLDAIADTLLGRRVDGIVQISDQAILVKGSNGPMIIPSAKTMGFVKEEGFLRVPSSSSDFDKLTAESIANIKEGRAANKEAQSMYLDILNDVEKLESTEKGRLVAETGNIENKLDQLYRVMASNSLAKQGLYYSSTVDPAAIKFGGRLRLQTSAQVGKFEVGVTEETLRAMSFGEKYTDIDRILHQARKGQLYTTAVREPAAGGRQMFQLKVKLLENSALASESVTKDFKFTGAAFLNTAMIQYGMEGDLDKDSISLYRLNSMSDETMEAMHRGQMESMEHALSKLAESPETIAGKKFRTIGDIQSFISDIDYGPEGVFRSDTAREETFRSLIDVVGPKHATPLYESHFRGRSYVDYMVGQIADMQSTRKSKNILRANLEERLSLDSQARMGGLLDQVSQIMRPSAPGTRGGRAATYQYTDVRNLIKYMHLKKVAHGGSGLASDRILDTLKTAGERARAEIANSKDVFARQILENSSEGTSTQAREMISTISENLLAGAKMLDDRKFISNLSEVNPQTLSLIHNLAGGEDAARKYAENIAKRMLFVEVMSEELKAGTGRTALGLPFESIIRDLSTVTKGLFDANALLAEAPGSVAMADIQGLSGGGIDELVGGQIQELTKRVERDTSERRRARAENQAIGSMGGSSHPEVPTSSYRNAIFSGEFFAKISQTKYFKPAAAIVGGLAGIESIRSAIDRFSPGNIPASGYNSANTMPPPPVMSSPQDPTFHADAMPNTNIARVARSQGARSSLNISGKMDNPPDFRGLTNQFALHNGYVPNIQGSFRSELNDTMSRTEISQHINSRLDSVF